MVYTLARRANAKTTMQTTTAFWPRLNFIINIFYFFFAKIKSKRGNWNCTARNCTVPQVVAAAWPIIIAIVVAAFCFMQPQNVAGTIRDKHSSNSNSSIYGNYLLKQTALKTKCNAGAHWLPADECLKYKMLRSSLN